MSGDDATIRLDHASKLVCTRCGGPMAREGGQAVCGACDVRVTLPAERTFGRFTLQRELGQGGFGVVWQAWDPQTSRRVALKILRESDAETLARFDREARTAADPRRLSAFQVRGLVRYFRGDHAGALGDLERIPNPHEDVRDAIEDCRKRLGEEF